MSADFPVSQFALGIVAIIAAMDSGLSPLMIAAWATAGIVVLSELLWRKLFWTRFWPTQGKLLTCIAIAVVVYAGAFFQFLQPHVVFESGNDYPFVFESPEGSWLRVKATNNGWREAHCRFFLHDLAGEDGSKKQFFRDEAIQLSLGGGQDISGLGWESWLGDGEHRYVNISQTLAGSGKMTVYSDQFKIQYPGGLLRGVYLFSIYASGTNCRSDVANIHVKYDGGMKITVLSP